MSPEGNTTLSAIKAYNGYHPDSVVFLPSGAGVNINDFQDKFAGYGFYKFLICLPSKKKIQPIRALKQLKSNVYLNKTAHFKPRTFEQAHFKIIKSF